MERQVTLNLTGPNAFRLSKHLFLQRRRVLGLFAVTLLIELLRDNLLGWRMNDGLESEHRGCKNKSAAHSSVIAKMDKEGVEEGEASNAKAYVKQHKKPLFGLGHGKRKAETGVPVPVFAR